MEVIFNTGSIDTAARIARRFASDPGSKTSPGILPGYENWEQNYQSGRIGYRSLERLRAECRYAATHVIEMKDGDCSRRAASGKAIEARAGLLRFISITSHLHAPSSTRPGRFGFDSVCSPPLHAHEIPMRR
jgi:hypothetical protein